MIRQVAGVLSAFIAVAHLAGCVRAVGSMRGAEHADSMRTRVLLDVPPTVVAVAPAPIRLSIEPPPGVLLADPTPVSDVWLVADDQLRPTEIAPPVAVYGDRPVAAPAPMFISRRAATSEEDPVGPNLQPEWTTRRRFATTRTYVLAPFQVEVESWWKGKFPKAGGSEHLFQEAMPLN